MKRRMTKIKDFATDRDCLFESTDLFWKFQHNNLEIDVRKSGDFDKDFTTIQKVLNENYGSGFTCAGNNCEPYVEYKIIPLNHDLEQKTDLKAEKQNKRLQQIIQIGSFVSGKSKKTDKEYSGQVIRFNRTNYNDIVSVYILARENGCIIPLDPETVCLSSPFPKTSVNRSKMDLGNIGMTNIM